MPGKHTEEEKRQAQHIKAGYIKKGTSPKKAESIAWATVNKGHGGGRKKGGGGKKKGR